jgi:acyl-CoA thioesterase I
MRTVALFFASGDSLYPGAGLLALAVTTTLFLQRGRLLILRSLATWAGLAMIAMASPPLTWWMGAIFATVFVLWLLQWNVLRSGSRFARLRLCSAAILVLLAALSGSELLHRRMPVIRGVPSDQLVVIGDSISAGIGGDATPWPVFFQQEVNVRVQNFSQPGAGVAEAMAMASRVTSQDSVILIEIGGNDLLSGVSSADFSRNLDLLLSRLAAPGRTFVMFELPLLPHKIGYGQAQRQLSSRYGVFLIPKHYLADVLGGANATTDGLHLSDTGARRMSALVERVLCDVLSCQRPGLGRL